MPSYLPDPLASDFLEAMRDIGSFVDITPGDAAALYRLAHRHAVKRLRDSILVGDLMTRQVLTLDPDMSITEGAKRLAGAGISGAPVARGGILLGVVSVKDFLSLLGLAKDTPATALVAGVFSGTACPPEGIESMVVSRIMTAPVVTVAPGVPAAEAARIMAEQGISRLPVMQAGELAGIITRTDLIRAFGDMLGDSA